MEGIFSFKHIIGLIWVFLLVGITLFITLKKSNKKTILKVSAIFLIVLEIIKDIYYIKTKGYLDIKYIPLQFCSLFIYIYPIVAFSSGKISKFVESFAYSGGLIASLLALFLPTNILGNVKVGWLDPHNFIHTISFIYHGTVLFFSLYLVLSKYYVPRKYDLWRSIAVTIFFVIIAVILNLILNTDFMMLNRGTGNPLSFLIKDYGHIVYIGIQFILMIVILYLVFLPFRFINKNSYRGE